VAAVFGAATRSSQAAETAGAGGLRRTCFVGATVTFFVDGDASFVGATVICFVGDRVNDLMTGREGWLVAGAVFNSVVGVPRLEPVVRATGDTGAFAAACRSATDVGFVPERAASGGASKGERGFGGSGGVMSSAGPVELPAGAEGSPAGAENGPAGKGWPSGTIGPPLTGHEAHSSGQSLQQVE
jgi:hypothetical protein